MQQPSPFLHGANEATASRWRATSWFARLAPERVFLWIALPFGLAVLFANPPFQAPDESDHFYRAFQLSEGTVIGERHGLSAGGQLPAIAIGVTDTGGIAFHPEKKMTAAIFRQKAKPLLADWAGQPRSYCHFPHTVYYPPMGYVPQATVLWAGRLMHLGPLALTYLARLSVYAFSVMLGFAALRRLPTFRWTALLFLVCPMSLYLMGSVATDGVLIGSAFLLLALAIPRADCENAFPRQLAVVLALASLLATTKVVYLPLAAAGAVLVAFTLPARRRWAFGAVLAVVTLLPLYMWGRAAADLYAPGRTDIPIDPVAQSHHMLAHPAQFVALVLKTIAADARGIYEWFVGTLGWGDTPMPHWYYTVFTVGLAGCAVLETGGPRLPRPWHRGVLLGGAVASALLIFAAQYASWNAPGSQQTIEGICGRYFLPVAPFVFVCLPMLPPLRIARWLAPLVGLLWGLTGAIVCLYAVIARFYLGG